MTGEVVLLVCGWLLWCTLHSLLIWPEVSSRLHEWLGSWRFCYRLFYNLFALATLLPMMAATAGMPGKVVFAWRGRWVVVEFLLLGVALWLFYDGARRYDFGWFFGIRQLREHRQPPLLAADGQFSRAGSHGMVRHPWYLGSLLFLWSFLPAYHLSSVVAAVVLSVYLLVGTLLEERKLVRACGERYRSYQREVSMLFPWKWLKKRFARRR